MPTPMNIYGAIAARYGVDSNNDAAVDEFFSSTLKEMEVADQESVLAELLNYDTSERSGSQLNDSRGEDTDRQTLLFISPIRLLKAGVNREFTRIMAGINQKELPRLLVVFCYAKDLSDLAILIEQNSPTVIHFSGHGRNDLGLTLMGTREREATSEQRHFVEILKNSRPALVYLSGCYSSKQAIALSKIVPLVVGTASTVPSDTALSIVTAYYKAFYKALGEGYSIECAAEISNDAANLLGKRGKFLAHGNMDNRILRPPADGGAKCV